MDKASRNRALQALPYGLYVVGSTNDGVASTIVANWITQVSFDPPLVAIAVEKDSKMQRAIERSGVFSINMLPAGAKDIARSFMKSNAPVGTMINGRGFTLSKHLAPILDDARAAIECTVVDSLSTGDHYTYVGEVTDAIVRSGGDILTLKETGWRYFK